MLPLWSGTFAPCFNVSALLCQQQQQQSFFHMSNKDCQDIMEKILNA
jgi:hypothetical protein